MKSNEAMLKLLQEYKLEELEKALRENFREECEKAAGKASSDIQISKRIMKKAVTPAMKKAHKFSFQGSDFYGITEGHYIIAGPDTFGLDVAEDHELIRMQNMFEVERSGSADVDVKDVKRFAKQIKLDKVLHPYPVKVNENQYILLDPSYLADVADFTGSVSVRYCPFDGAIGKAPVAIFGESKIGLILPVFSNVLDKVITYYESTK